MIQFLVSATTLLMSTIAPMNFYTIVEDASDLPLLNPDLQDRKSLKLQLANGMEALLISDKSADQSAAAIRVGIGSWNDPIEYPGMAHFCEHMLFMGTKKYPSENEFFSLVSDYAGLTNAFTAPNRTVYMFSAQTTGFIPLLDRFAHFFIDPLFNPANIAREMHAVDQEFAKNVENDSWREYMIFKETANPNHPIRMFSTGNSETLGNIPQDVLSKWHEEHYGSERMHLVIYSPLPLDTLKETVVEIFSEVPQSRKVARDTTGPLSSPEQMGSIAYIKPIKNRQSLTLSWELPSALSDDDSKSIDMIAHALRRGQKYSLYEKLKNGQMIDSLSTRVDEMGGKKHRFFQMSLELTKKGIEELETTILHCFEAIAGIKKSGVPLYLFEEKNAMAQINYQYQERQNPFDYITKIADSIADESLDTFPKNSLLAKEYNPEKIASAASLLTPKTCFISLMAHPNLTKVFPNKQEKWLGAEYAIKPIPEKWMQTWSTAMPNDTIRIPEPNPFIPQNLALVTGEEGPPTVIADDSLGLAYYVRSPEFGTPESVYHIHILSPEIDKSARSAVLSSLYIDHLTDVLHPTLAAAHSAGLSCNFSQDKCALHLEVSGYSEKAPLLLQEIARQMPLNPPTPEQFSVYFDRHEKAYHNAQKELAARQAKETADSILNEDVATKREKLAALETITYGDFLAFHQKLFEKTYLKALFAGNLSKKKAESAWLDVIHALARAPFPKEEHHKTKILRLPEQSGPFYLSQNTDVQGNAALLLIDQGDFTHKRRAAQEILGAAIKEPFFSELRSKQKTGYIAQSAATEMEERLFQYFVVQSNSHQPQELLFRFEQFIEEFNDQITETFTKERFETLKESLISSLVTRFRNLSAKSALWDNLCFERDGDFAFVENRIQALKDISYQDFMKMVKEFLNRQNRKRLAILFEGKLAEPFAYLPIEKYEIGEIATYAPRNRERVLQESASVAID